MTRWFTRRALCTAALAALALTLSACKNDEGSTTQPAMRGTGNTTMMSAMNDTCCCGMKVNPNAPTAAYMGQTIGFCCSACAARWNSMTSAQKEQFMQKQMAMMGAMNEHCICGAPVVKGVQMTSYQGRMIGFCEPECATRWNSMSAASRKEFMQKETAMMGAMNAMCWCGQAVKATAPTSSYMGHTVGFCCSNCASQWNSMTDAERSRYMNTIAGHPNN